MQAIHFLWDIDGTLVGRSEGPIEAWKELAERMLGSRFEWDQLDAGGSTDPLIAAGICDLFPEAADYCTAEQICAAYRELACRNLRTQPCPPLPASQALFREAASSPFCSNFFLTGNFRQVAASKLLGSGLSVSELTGGFAEHGPARARIARHAAAEALTLRPGRLVVVGDTPRDVAAARAIDAVAVIVGNGQAKPEAVQAATPDLFYPALPGLDDLLADLDRIRRAQATSAVS
ncbi:HAD family hydrolase [Desulfocurvibacter africanus]|uniref:Haloacid dehalogenase domain protein hydrolase n=1 Tax=Desulfocurvibacter africanus subsp. africanus str. Walvis Bay TaxID=690850 RepID=F3Z3J7_DESAF|nr:HAD family hydrolase [Desulfocurvibacter africanus]EGJ50369.1 Haloacid dehalogenase domain protein hydrolase [Desulfocurvibacter africanus subsp. africanus str. Walvis Bay]